MNFKFLQKNAKVLFAFLFLFSSVMAQDRNITGKVTDSKDGGILPGVTVNVKGRSIRVSTNGDGQFTINANPATESLVFSFIGYTTQTIALEGKTSVTVALTADNKNLDEIVVTGYGSRVKKSSITGAVATIKAEEFEDLPVANLSLALKDRVAGLAVATTSGKPGSEVGLRIRNPTTFSQSAALGISSSPLYVIDGITVTESDFNNLDASVVDNITFLKDASAAIYGAAGAKGVVLVTTKRGKPGKPQISYSGYFGTSDAANTPKILSGYDHAKYLNDGYDLTSGSFQSTLKFSQADLDFIASEPYKSWYDELWHSSQLQRHTVNISGGGKDVTYFIGANYYDEGGNFGKIDVNKYGLRSSVTADVTPSVRVSIDLNGDLSKSDRNTNKNSNGNTEDVMMKAMYLTPRWVPLTINGLPVNWKDAPNPPTAWNPLALMNSGTYERNEGANLSANASVTYTPKFIPGFSAKVQYARKQNYSNSKAYYVPYRIYNFTKIGQNSRLYSEIPDPAGAVTLITRNDRINAGTSAGSNYQLISQLNYTKKIGRHSFDALVVTEQTESNANSYAVYRDGQQIPGMDEFFAFNTSTTTADIKGASESGKRSYLSRVNYSFADKYLLEFVGRYDGSANFPPDKRWGFFPALGLGWRVSEEPFFKNNVNFINSLKIRVNVGLVGDDRTSKYQYIARFTQAPQAYLFGNNVVNGLDNGLFPNPDITWEKSRTQNYGIDAMFLKDRLSLTVDVWNRHTYDGLDEFGTVGLPWPVGTATGIRNNGIQNAWGTEVSVGYADKINKNWNFSVNGFANFANDQTIVYYYPRTAVGNVDSFTPILIGQSSRIYNGNNYGYITTGILKTQEDVDALLSANPNYTIGGQKPQVGFMNYQDRNGDGIINEKDITLMYPKGTEPTVNMGFTLGIGYKAFRLSTNFNFAIGGKYFVDADARTVPTAIASGAEFWKDHWTPETPNAKYPRFDAPLFKENSTFWSLPGVSGRINNMTLSFSIPPSITKQIGVANIRGLITGTNLWDIVNPYKYKDLSTQGFATYPALRTFSLGLNIGL